MRAQCYVQISYQLSLGENPKENAQFNKACPLSPKGTLSSVREAHVELTTSIARIQVKLCRVDTSSDLKRKHQSSGDPPEDNGETYLNPRIVTCSRKRGSSDETVRHPILAEIARTLGSTKRLRVHFCVRYQFYNNKRFDRGLIRDQYGLEHTTRHRRE